MIKEIVPKEDVTLRLATEDDREWFFFLRQHVMKPHVANQGLPWVQANEDAYHAELFDRPGLFVVLYKGVDVGFVGVHRHETGEIEISRGCHDPLYQDKGIGTRVLEMICGACYPGQTVIVDALTHNRANSLLARVGFERVSSDGKLNFYQKKIPEPSF